MTCPPSASPYFQNSRQAKLYIYRHEARPSVGLGSFLVGACTLTLKFSQWVVSACPPPGPVAESTRIAIMLVAAPLVAAWSLQPFPPPHRPHRSRAPICSLDSLFTEQTAELNRQLDLPGEESEASRSISALHDTSIAPLLPAVWSSEFQDRKDAIIKLSTGLDELEASSSGPLLTGDAFASCDAQCFPTFCLLSWALPRHFGWEEYTTDALFWKRPRLHAWFDLCSYEKPCRDAAAKIERELEAIEYWPEISVDVPTNKLRKRVRKDL